MLFVFPACDCNPAGSESLQCDRDTGKCQCKQGTIGDKCDQCDADTTGKMPQCEVCGDCYYQWKITLDDLSRNVSVEISRAYNISLTPNQPGINKQFTLEIKISKPHVKIKAQQNCIGMVQIQ